MKEFTVAMAIVDFIPVICFTIATILLQRDLYQVLHKGAYALFSAGTIDICFAGGLKALYKLLYAAGICDFTTLNHLFFPLQALGFMLAGLGVMGMILHSRSKNTVLYSAAVPVTFSGTMIFVGVMVIGMICMNVGLAIIAFRRKRVMAGIMFLFSMVFSMMMGYLASKQFEAAFMNWMAEAVNVIGQASILIGAVLLHRKYSAKSYVS